MMENLCNELVKQFLQICQEINFPVSLDKTKWATQIIVFLGLLLNMKLQIVCIPFNKRDKALKLLNEVSSSRTVTVLKLQQLAGLLNYLCHVIVPGHSFTRKFHVKTKGLTMKPYHHVNVDREMKLDCKM